MGGLFGGGSRRGGSQQQGYTGAGSQQGGGTIAGASDPGWGYEVDPETGRRRIDDVFIKSFSGGNPYDQDPLGYSVVGKGDPTGMSQAWGQQQGIEGLGQPSIAGNTEIRAAQKEAKYGVWDQMYKQRQTLAGGGGRT